jgi:Protein of unknown function (DUF2934)
MEKRHKSGTRVCEGLALPGATPAKTTQAIARRAYALWLARGFRNGSPQEDWLQAQRELPAIRKT